MWINERQELIGDGSPYADNEGTRYPGNFPKGQIAELSPVVLVDQPPLTEYQSASSAIELVDGVWTQIWTITRLSNMEIEELLNSLRRQKMDTINFEFEQRMAPIAAGYPALEQQTWPKQEMEARNYLADSNAQTTMIDALCAKRGIDKAELVARIIASADAISAYCGNLMGNRQRLEDALDLCTTFDEINNINPADGWEN